MIGDRGPDWEERRRDKLRLSREKGARRRKYILTVTAMVAATVILAGTLAFVLKSPQKPSPRPTGNEVNGYNATAVSVPASSVSDTVHYYKWNAPGKAIRFFAVMGSDGHVRTAFDNAYCCFRNDLGERQEGSTMVCNWCNKAYPIDELNRGNLNATMALQCCPANLPSEVLGNDVVIQKSDLEAGAYLFR